MKNFKKHAVVTGGGTGVGESLALQYVSYTHVTLPTTTYV